MHRSSMIALACSLFAGCAVSGMEPIDEDLEKGDTFAEGRLIFGDINPVPAEFGAPMDVEIEAVTNGARMTVGGDMAVYNPKPTDSFYFTVSGDGIIEQFNSFKFVLVYSDVGAEDWETYRFDPPDTLSINFFSEIEINLQSGEVSVVDGDFPPQIERAFRGRDLKFGVLPIPSDVFGDLDGSYDVTVDSSLD